MFASLAVANYRLYFVGEGVSVIGNWMQNVGLAWLVLEQTGSGTALGLLVGARYFPVLLLSLYGGGLADRRDRRRLLYLLHAMGCALSACLFVVALLDDAPTWTVFAFALGIGLVDAVSGPTRQSIVATLVESRLLPNAIVLNSLMMNLARIVGPALAGVVVASVGAAWCFGANALSFLVLLGALALMDSSRFVRAELVGPAQNVLSGIAYAWQNLVVRSALLLILVIGMFAWEFQVTLPLLTKETFHRGAATYGLLFGCMSFGAVAGGLVIARLGPPRPVTIARAAIAWGLTMSVAAFAPNVPLACAAFGLVGVAVIAFNSQAKTLLQLGSHPARRGRVMALWVLTWQGSTPLGAPLVGWVGEHLGARWSLLAGSLPTLLVGAALYRPLGRLAVPDHTGDPLATNQR